MSHCIQSIQNKSPLLERLQTSASRNIFGGRSTKASFCFSLQSAAMGDFTEGHLMVWAQDLDMLHRTAEMQNMHRHTYPCHENPSQLWN